MNFQALQNRVIWRTRQYGYNFAGAPAYSDNNFVGPTNLSQIINEGYNDFLVRTVDDQIATLQVQFLTANASTNAATFVNLRPIPAQVAPLGSLVNPAALKVYEFTYFQQNSENPGISGEIERYIPCISSSRFRRWAGAYTRRVGNFSSYPQAASQQFGEPTLQVIPGFGVNGDTVQLTVCPDPQNSPSGCPATNGGILTNPTDVPLFPSQFHRALVEYATAEIAEAINNPDAVARARGEYERLVQDAHDFGAAYTEGDPEMETADIWRDISDPSMLV